MQDLRETLCKVRKLWKKYLLRALIFLLYDEAEPNKAALALSQGSKNVTELGLARLHFYHNFASA